jgi:hypothetical protein
VPTLNALGEGEYVVSSASGTLAIVPVEQATDAGQWVGLGTYQVAGPAMTIQLMPKAGASSTAGSASELPGLPALISEFLPVAASAARATCHR